MENPALSRLDQSVLLQVLRCFTATSSRRRSSISLRSCQLCSPRPVPNLLFVSSKDADRVFRGDNGSLTDAERTRLHEGLRAEYRRSIVKKFDRNRDGKLDEAEGRALDADQAARTDKWRQRMELMEWDANRNARLDPAERDKRDKHLAELRRRAKDRRGEWVRRWDGDGDGKLSGEELAAATAGISERVARQRREMDTDGDGRITAKEIRAYRKKLFGRRPAGATTRRGGPP